MVGTVEAPSRKKYVSRTWKAILLEGAIASGVGLYLLIRPAGTLSTLVRVLGVFWFADGLIRFLASAGERMELSWTRPAGAVILAALGVLALAYPLYASAIPSALPSEILSMAAALLSLAGGILSVSWGINRGGLIYGDGWTVLSGLFSILAGFILLSAPFILLRAADALIGLLALMTGIGLIINSLGMRRQGTD